MATATAIGGDGNSRVCSGEGAEARERAESEGEERGATGHLRGIARRPGEEAGGGQGGVGAPASCFVRWRGEEDARAPGGLAGPAGPPGGAR